MVEFTSYMQIALDEARAAGARGEVPVGAVIVGPGGVVARDGNRTAIPDDYLPKNYQPGGFTVNCPHRSPAPQSANQG